MTVSKADDNPLQRWPMWIQDIIRSLPIRAQFVLSGNIRDKFLAPKDDTLEPVSLLDCLWRSLELEGYDGLIVYDRIDGLRPFPERCSPLISKMLGVTFRDNQLTVTFEHLVNHLRRVVMPTNPPVSTDPRVAIVIDYASRICSDPEDLSPEEFVFFAAIEKLSHSAKPKIKQDQPPRPLFNPIVWLVNREHDLPHWFTVGNESIRSIPIAPPDYNLRKTAALNFCRCLPDSSSASEKQVDDFSKAFADQTEGLTLRSLSSITTLAAAANPPLPMNEIASAVRAFKVGIADNPWKKEHIRERIRSAPTKIAEDVIGQDHAIQHAIDCLTRSVMGLSGAQASSNTGRPRGVLFFAGPTGVGKTELAKSITRQLFHDERAYIRFDMSEFSSEHSDARLIGSPPGYVGSESGGELTNAIRQRPFSVVLFDEIEKAHPRILDKFIQVLEDGRLTDGRGDTVYFSESIIIFTSNLGIYVPERNEFGGVVWHENKQLTSDTEHTNYEQVKQEVGNAIENYFKRFLLRPEILNRLGDNIVVFDFIRTKAGENIFAKMLEKVIGRVKEQYRSELDIRANVKETLKQFCTADLRNGGRGIGNKLESSFINPLSRALFDLVDVEERKITVASIEITGTESRVILT